MINELIEKQVKIFSTKLAIFIVNKELSEEEVIVGDLKNILRSSLKTIAKEVAMRFKGEESDCFASEWEQGYDERVVENNNLADQIIDEVSQKTPMTSEDFLTPGEKLELLEDKVTENESVLYHKLTEIIFEMNNKKEICSGMAQALQDQIFDIIIIHQQKTHLK